VVQPDELSSGLLSDTRRWHLASLFLLKPLRSFWKSWLVSCRVHRRFTGALGQWILFWTENSASPKSDGAMAARAGRPVES
jgi:hypothetical protein